MFTARKETVPTGLEKTIDTLLDRMAVVECDSTEYAQMADQLVKLYKLKEIDAPKRISPDTKALIAGNLAGIVLIIGYERANVITSKALGFVLKSIR